MDPTNSHWHRRRALALFAIGNHETADASLETGYNEACRYGAGLFARAIALAGIKQSRGRRQIIWQTRYHGEMTSIATPKDNACGGHHPTHSSPQC
jgi:hypothetical protein